MKIEQPTLIILTPGFPKDEADTACLTSQQSFVRAVNKNFPAVRIVVLSFQYPFTSGSYTWHGNHVIAFNGRNRGNIFRLLLWRRVLKELKAIHTKDTVTGLLSFWCGEAALIGDRFGRKYNIKHYCWIQGQDAKKENHYVRRIQPTASSLIAISDFIQTEFEKNHRVRPQHLVPPGIDPSGFPLQKMERDIDVLGVGSLISLKQYDLFIEIIKDLKDLFPAIKAVLCGKGPEEEKLKQLIEKNGLQQNIILAGELSHPEILKQMKRSKIFLHTSNYEGFGLVCIEALYAGTPVISFVKPMKKDIEHWYIANDKEDMLQKAKTLLQNDPAGHEPVLPYLADDSAIAVMRLFGFER